MCQEMVELMDRTGKIIRMLGRGSGFDAFRLGHSILRIESGDSCLAGMLLQSEVVVFSKT